MSGHGGDLLGFDQTFAFGALRMLGVARIPASSHPAATCSSWHARRVGLVQHLSVAALDAFDDARIDLAAVGEIRSGAGDFHRCDCRGTQGQGEVARQFVALTRQLM